MKFSPTRTYTYKMKSIQTIFSLIASVLLTCGCGRELPFDDPQKGNGKESICISLNTSNIAETKAGTAKDGDVMNNIYIWIADGSDKIVYSGSYANGSSEGCSFELAGDGKTATAVFTNVERGEYTLYVIANLPASLSGLTSKTTADNDFKNAVLPDLVANKPPFTEDDGMPLSMRQSIHVGPGMNIVETQLVRVCGRIRVTVRNMTTDKNIFIQSFQLTDKNPSTGYIFHKDDHGTPDGIAFGAFEKYELTGTQTTRYIAPGGEDTYIDQYLYETGLTGMGKLGFEIVGGIYEGTVKSAQVGKIETTTYSQGPALPSGYNTTTDYLIVNNEGNYYYLYNNSNTPSLNILTDANLSELLNAGTFGGVNIRNYLWRFTSTGNQTGLQNQGNSRYLTISNNSIGFSQNTATINVNKTDGLRFYYDSSNDYDYDYYMYAYNASLNVNQYSTTNDNRYWKLIPITIETQTQGQLKDALKNFSKTNDSITYIDQYGLPVTLEHICRNDDINVVINVFYSPESGVLYFRVEDWTDVSNNTTFD